jgi:hypothetical protein
MTILFLATVITGFAEGHIHPGDSGHHTVIAILFVISTVTHAAINRKAFARHFNSPAQKPAVK